MSQTALAARCSVSSQWVTYKLQGERRWTLDDVELVARALDIPVTWLALLGVVQELCWARGARVSSLALYILMGWLALVAVGPLWRALTPGGFAWLLAGGACYTLGIAFYALDHRIRHGHGLWHLFVLGGSACHFVTVLFYVA